MLQKGRPFAPIAKAPSDNGQRKVLAACLLADIEEDIVLKCSALWGCGGGGCESPTGKGEATALIALSPL